MASINTSGTTSSTTPVQNGRYWGLASGLDVDSIVTALVAKQQAKIDKAMQKQQSLQWKQTAYQDVISKLNAFESSYLVLGQSTSLAGSNMYTSFATTSSNPALVTATANSDASGTTQNVTIVQSATTASLSGTAVKENIVGAASLDTALANLKAYAAGAENYGSADPSMTVTVDGITKTISFGASELGGVSDSDGLVDLLNSKLAAAFGQVRSSVDGSSVTKVVASVGPGNVLQLSAGGGYQSQITVSSSGTTFDARMLGAMVKTASDNGTAMPQLAVTFDGVTKTIEFSPGDDLSESGYLATINQKIADAFPDKGLTATVDSKGALTVKDGSDTAASVTPKNTDTSALSVFNIASGTGNRLNTGSTTLGSLLASKGITATPDENGVYYATINGQSVKLGTANSSLSDVFASINTSGAGVTIAYNKTLDTVSLTANQGGASGRVDVSSDTSGLFAALGISGSNTGRDAIISVNGVNYTRDTNSFVIDGVTYTLSQDLDPTSADYPSAASRTSQIVFTKDTSALSKGLQDFINAYNDLVSSLRSQISTAPDSDYPPLTDTQKSQMTQDQIDKWNQKAQSGLLYQDDTVATILDNMRSVLYQPVTCSDGTTISLYDIGITTSDYADEFGKLEIKTQDQSKFDNAVATMTDKIKQLFTKSSDILLDISPQTAQGSADQKLRMQQEGLVARLDDLIKGSAGSVSGNKGSLLQIAGKKDDSTQYNNFIYSQLNDVGDLISTLKDQLQDQKDRYYRQFQLLETYMERANSQSSMLSTFSGS